MKIIRIKTEELIDWFPLMTNQEIQDYPYCIFTINKDAKRITYQFGEFPDSNIDDKELPTNDFAETATEIVELGEEI